MPLQPTSLTITPTWVNKGLTLAGGAPAVREHVAIRVVGAATAGSTVPEGFYVRVVPVGHPCTVYPPWHPAVATVPAALEYARFPKAAGDVWTVSGSDLTAILDLDTASLCLAFDGTPIDSQIEARIVLESGSADNLYALGRLYIRNWPQDGEDPVSGSSVLKQRVDALEEDLAAEVEAREAADTAEALARAAADNILTAQVATKANRDDLLQELADRTAADGALSAQIAVKASTVALEQEVDDREAADIALGAQLAGKANQSALEQEIADRAAADAAHAGRSDNPHGVAWDQVNNNGQAEGIAAAAVSNHNGAGDSHTDLRGKIRFIGDRLVIECPDGQYRKIIAVANELDEFMLAIDNALVYNWDENTQEWVVAE